MDNLSIKKKKVYYEAYNLIRKAQSTVLKGMGQLTVPCYAISKLHVRGK